MTTFKLTATYVSHDPTVPQRWEVGARFETLDEARAFIATLPKGLKMKASSLITYNEQGLTVMKAYVHTSVRLTSDGTNKGRNETGIRRYWLAKETLELKYSAGYGNSYSTQHDFEAAIV